MCVVLCKNKRERYSRVRRLSDTRYSAKGTKWSLLQAVSEIEMRHLPAI